MSRNLRYTEDELRDQWAFIDSLVESQAAALRSGAQDPEEEVVELASATPGLQHELDVLRARIRALETERRELLERLRIAEMVMAPAPQQPPRGAAPPARQDGSRVPVAQPRTVESKIRSWWRRVIR